MELVKDIRLVNGKAMHFYEGYMDTHHGKRSIGLHMGMTYDAL
jgi:hypothetical protein